MLPHRVFLKGFTFIELTITTVIMGIISLAIFSAFAGGIKIYRKVQEYGRNYVLVVFSLEKMEKDLRNTFGIAEIHFTGESRQIFFPGLVGVIGAGGRNLSLGRICYSFDSEKKALFRREQDYPAVMAGAEVGKSEFRVETFAEDMRFSYYYFDRDAQQYAWKDSWDEKETLPLGVKIYTSFKEDDKDVSIERTVLFPVSS